MLYLIIACGVLSIVYGVVTTRAVLASDPGTARMQEIAAAIQEGAAAYLARQYTTIAVVGVVIFLILAYLLGLPQAVGFAIGAVLSGAAGYIGMNVSVRANVRTAQAATKSLGDGLSLAFRAGAITGLLVAGLALLGVSVYFLVLTSMLGYEPASRVVVGAPATSATSVEVPPMSSVSSMGRREARPMRCAPSTPPAGPDSTVCTG
jgi:K(+)-stimulated pyrophosphate-energized sodium pump